MESPDTLTTVTSSMEVTEGGGGGWEDNEAVRSSALLIVYFVALLEYSRYCFAAHLSVAHISKARSSNKIQVQDNDLSVGWGE